MLSLQLGAVVGVAVRALLALVGVALLVQHLLVRLVVDAAGGMFLLWLTWQAFRAACHGTGLGVAAADAPSASPAPPSTHAPSVRSDAALGVALSLANPGALAFWPGSGNTVVAPGAVGADLPSLLVFLTGLLAGAVLWCVVLAGVLS